MICIQKQKQTININIKSSAYNSYRDNSSDSSDSSDESDNSSDSSDSSNDNIIIEKCKKIPQKIQNKYRKKPIPSTVKRLVWNKYIGENIGKYKCYCCKLTDITQLSFHCGHVISEKKGGQIDVNNLRPICQNCNSSMGFKNMDDFINEYRIHK